MKNIILIILFLFISNARAQKIIKIEGEAGVIANRYKNSSIATCPPASGGLQATLNIGGGLVFDNVNCISNGTYKLTVFYNTWGNVGIRFFANEIRTDVSMDTNRQYCGSGALGIAVANIKLLEGDNDLRIEYHHNSWLSIDYFTLELVTTDNCKCYK